MVPRCSWGPLWCLQRRQVTMIMVRMFPRVQGFSSFLNFCSSLSGSGSQTVMGPTLVWKHQRVTMIMVRMFPRIQGIRYLWNFPVMAILGGSRHQKPQVQKFSDPGFLRIRKFLIFRNPQAENFCRAEIFCETENFCKTENFCNLDEKGLRRGSRLRRLLEFIIIVLYFA